jgi:hypothetical protein
MSVIDNLELGAVTRRDRAAIKGDLASMLQCSPSSRSVVTSMLAP